MSPELKEEYSYDFILIGVLAGLVAILDYIGVVGFPIGILGVSGFYVGGAFYTAFSVWFGKGGLISIYLGLLIGAVIAGTFTIFAFVLALGNVFGAAIPMLVLKRDRFNVELKNKKDIAAFLLSAMLGRNIVSAAWTLPGFYLVGMMPYEALIPSAIGWIVGGMVVSIVIGIPLLKFVSPVVKKSPFFSEKIF